jgi:uncharacterized protein (DUF2235 family)
LKVPFTSDNSDISIGRHAISIDERRAFFRSNRWIHSRDSREHGPRDVKQVWFAGVHCDIGGGYSEPESGLSKITLEWMLEEAKTAGLQVNDARQNEIMGRVPGSGHVAPDSNAFAHESLRGWWRIAEWVRKPHYDFFTGKTEMRMNRGKRRTIPANSLVHESVFERQNGEYAKRLPADSIRVSTHAANLKSSTAG